MILRCGWQLGVEYCDDDPPELLPDTVRMSFDRRAFSNCKAGSFKWLRDDSMLQGYKGIPATILTKRLEQ